jgi:hypothetical protein
MPAEAVDSHVHLLRMGCWRDNTAADIERVMAHVAATAAVYPCGADTFVRMHAQLNGLRQAFDEMSFATDDHD